MSSRKNNNYSIEVKQAAVESYLSGEGSYLAICKKFQIPSTRTLRSWVAKVKRNESLESMTGETRGSIHGRPKTRFTSLEKELEYTKAERDYLKKLYRFRFGTEWEAGK